MLAAAYTILSGIGIVVGVLIGLAGAVALTWTYFKGNAGSELIKQQDAAINALKEICDLQEKKITSQEREIAELKESDRRRSDEMARLTELVTQAAKVDQLIILVQDGFEQLGVNVKVIHK